MRCWDKHAHADKANPASSAQTELISSRAHQTPKIYAAQRPWRVDTCFVVASRFMAVARTRSCEVSSPSSLAMSRTAAASVGGAEPRVPASAWAARVTAACCARMAALL
eukprot:6184637-Pleurochrysis_carterae.AAC.3